MLGGLFKVGILALAVAGGYYLYSEAKNRVGFKIKGYGIPVPGQNLQVLLPVKIQFNNPTPVAINSDRLVVDVYVMANNFWAQVAHLDQPVAIPPGSNVIEVRPLLNLDNIITNIADVVSSFLDTRSISVRTDVTASFAGVQFPTQQFTDTVKV